MNAPTPPPAPLRILFVANTLPPRDLSGVGEQVLQLAAGLQARGHQVEVLGRGAGGARGPKLLFPLTAVWPTLRAVRRWRPDVVQVHESDGGLVALALILIRPFQRAPPRLVALQQVSYVEERRAVRPLVDPEGRVLGRPGAVERRFRWLRAPLHVVLGRLTAQLADRAPGGRVLAPSAATAAELRRDYRLARLPAVVPNATGGLPAPSPVAPAAFADVPPGYLLFVGRLRIRKGVEVLLHALATLAAEGRAATLLVAGDGEHRAALEQTAAALGLGARVRFLGRAAAAEVRALLAGAAALVVPSTYEGMPLVVLEAMAAGLPVVASRVSGIPEVVRDGETGWLVPPEDPIALARALGELLADPTAARRRGEAGRQRLVEHTPQEVAARWLAALTDCEPTGLAAHPPCPPRGWARGAGGE